MVLKFILLLVIIVSSVHAQSGLNGYELARLHFNKKDYARTLTTLNKYFSIKKFSNKTPAKAYLLAGKSFAALKNYRLAVNVYRSAVKREFPTEHKLAMKTYFEQGNAAGLDELPPKIYKYYYLILINSVRYGNDLINTGKGPNKSINQYVEVLGSILQEADFKSESVEKLVASFEIKIQEIEKREFHSNWYINLGYVSWQDNVKYVEANGKKNDLIAPAEGFGAGLGWRKMNFYWGYKFETNFSMLKANAGFNSDTASYFQQGVDVKMVDVKAGAFIKPFTGDVSIGLNVPLMYTSGDYTVLEDAKIEGATKFTSGLLLEGIWYVGDWSLSSQFGKIVGLNSAFWDLHISYYF